MAEQLWKGRFSKAVDSRVNDFNSSIRFDQRMIAQDMRGSGVHAAMLAKQGIISEKDCEDILSGLASIADDLASGALTIDPNAEDVHTFVEQTLTARIGDAGKRLHTGRSRNDQVALDIRLTLRDYSHTLQATSWSWSRSSAGSRREHHRRHARLHPPAARPAHHLRPCADGLRFHAAARPRPLCGRHRPHGQPVPAGLGCAGRHYLPLDRDFTRRKAGFAAPCANSLDGVSDRDFCIELASAISICMMHLSRLSEEIILWCSWEFKFIELDDAFTTGSSIMPQKKNPDVTELIRGKTGRVYGDLNTLLVMMKGLPLAYNKDMQEDKEAIFDAVDTLELCLKTITPMLDTMKTLPANMRRAAAKGFINATDCADYLTKKGMPFRDAYKLTGCMVSDCIAKDKTLEELTLDEFKGYSALFENDIYDAIDLVKCCEGRTSYGGPSEASVNNQIALANAQLDAWEGKERMSVKVFIDGSSGTTGLRIADVWHTPGDRAAFHFRRGPQGCERAREGDQLCRPRLPLPAGCRFQRGHAPAAPGREGAGHLHRLPHRCRMGLRLPGAGGPEGKNQKFLPAWQCRLLCQRLYHALPARWWSWALHRPIIPSAAPASPATPAAAKR